MYMDMLYELCRMHISWIKLCFCVNSTVICNTCHMKIFQNWRFIPYLHDNCSLYFIPHPWLFQMTSWLPLMSSWLDRVCRGQITRGSDPISVLQGASAYLSYFVFMITSWQGNAFCVSDRLWGKCRCGISLTKDQLCRNVYVCCSLE